MVIVEKMNLFKTLLPAVSGLSQVTKTGFGLNRLFSSLVFKQQPNQDYTKLRSILPGISQAPYLEVDQQCRTYKHKDILKRRCPGCYFVKKNGVLHVECDLKPRHKQIQKMRGDRLYKDDYSKGKWKAAIHWGWKSRAFYKQANEKFVKYNWLEGRIGRDL